MPTTTSDGASMYEAGAVARGKLLIAHGRPAYLGDGVYACFDGYSIWLSTQRDSGIHRIALEPRVLARLIAYAAHLRGEPEPGAAP